MLDTGIDAGMELSERMEEMTADQAVQLVRELCAGLESGDGGAFHGNIWPGSVRLDEDGHASLGEGSDVPVSGRTAGQVEYVAPEFFWDNEGTGASDVYSLGLMLYAGCNGGYLPFQPKGGALTDKDRSGALRKRMKGEDIPLPAGVSAELGAVLRKALAYEPEDRYAGPAELLAALSGTDEALPAASDAAAEADEDTLPPEEDIPSWALGEEAEDIPAGDESAAEDEPEEKRYTVQKDFEKTRSRASAAPATRTRRKKTSPVIPILCVAAAGVIIGGVWYALNHRAPSASPALDLDNTTISEPVVLPADTPAPTEPPAPDEDVHTVSLLDLEEEEETKDAPEDAEQTVEDENAVGSPSIDGQEVTAASDTVYVTGTGVNLRLGPGTAYDVAKTLSRGAKLKRTGTVNGWSQVQYEGKEYYVSSSLISTEDPNGGDETGETETVDSGSAAATPAPTAAPASSSATPAAASVTATRDVVTVTGAEVNLRTGPGTNYSVSTTVKSGTELQRTGTTGSWSRVEYQGKELYISNSMIRTVSADQVSSGTGTLKVTGDVNVRSGPDTTYDILGIARTGDTLTVTGLVDGKWYRVSYNGKDGYVNRNFVSVQDFSLVSDQTSKVEIVSKANIRSGPGTSYTILGVADVGATLTVTGYTGSNWYEVNYNGETGYVAGNLVKSVG